MNEQINEEIDFLNKELKDIKAGKDILKSSQKLIEHKLKNLLEKQRAMLIQNPNILLEIQKEDNLEDFKKEQENIERKEIQEIVAENEDG